MLQSMPKKKHKKMLSNFSTVEQEVVPLHACKNCNKLQLKKPKSASKKRKIDRSPNKYEKALSEQ